MAMRRPAEHLPALPVLTWYFANDVPNLWLGIPNEHWAFAKDLVIPEKKTGYLTIRTAKDWHWNK